VERLHDIDDRSKIPGLVKRENEGKKYQKEKFWNSEKRGRIVLENCAFLI
jgi:hypothetical protein